MRERLLYSVFALGMTLAFMVVRFPGDEVLGFLDAGLKALRPDLSLTAERISLWPPLGLRLKAPVVAGQGLRPPGKAVIKAGSLYTAPHLAELLGGRYGMGLKAANGRLELSTMLPGLPAVSFAELSLTATLVERKRVDLTLELNGPEFTGTLAGTITLDADLQSSRLELKGSAEPVASFLQEHPEMGEGLKLFKKYLKNGRYSFTVSGTVQGPKFQLI